MIYEIKINGQVVEPADKNVNKIYAGSHLIWERKRQSKTPDFRFAGYKFTRAGLLIPGSLTRGIKDIYNLNGEKVSEFDTTNILTDSEGAVFVWSDIPAYSISTTEGTLYARATGEFLYADKSSQNVLLKGALNLTETESQWSGYYTSICQYIRQNPTTIAGPGGGGLLPLSRPIGGYSGADKIGPLCYVKDGSLVTGGDYVVLAVCGDSMICGENVTLQNSSRGAFGLITERTLSGELIQTLIETRQRIITYNTTENARHFYKAGNALYYYYTSGGTQYLRVLNLTDKTTADVNFSSKPAPESVFYYNGKYYYLGPNYIAYSENPTPSVYDARTYIPDDEFGAYEIANPNTQGSYYVDEAAGVVYVIARSKTTYPTGSGGMIPNYKLCRVTLEA